MRLIVSCTSALVAAGTILFLAAARVAGAQPFLVKDINDTVTLGSDPANLTNVEGMVFFTACDGVAGCELWKSDGTATGTVRVADLEPGPLGSYPAYLTAVGNIVFFVTRSLEGGRASGLWRSDGTAAGTVRLDVPGLDAASIYGLTGANGLLFFTGADSSTGSELWRSDGTASGTVRVADINPGPAGSWPAHLTAVDGSVFFTAVTDGQGSGLWRSDGTAEGTVFVAPLEAKVSYPTSANGMFFFQGEEPSATELTATTLWRSDGTAAGTFRLGYILPVYENDHSLPVPYFTDVNGTLFFVASDGSGRRLWKSDGTVAGTVPVASSSNVGPDHPRHPAALVAVDGTLFFRATDGTAGSELWRSDGTGAGTIRVADINPGPASSHPSNLTNVNGTLLFVATDASGERALWRSDGTAAGRLAPVTLPSSYDDEDAPNVPLTVADRTAFFAACTASSGCELWRSDGTEGGTQQVTDINTSTPGSDPLDLTAVGGAVFFTAEVAGQGRKLWRSDGTAAGTVRVADVDVKSDTLYLRQLSELTNVGGRLFFVGYEPETGFELWSSDGTTAGTVRITDINPGPASSYPESLTDVDGTLFFLVENGLWKSDGTPGGTVRVADQTLYSPEPFLAHVNGTVFLISGGGLWRSDGTPAGTSLVASLGLDAFGSFPPPTLRSVGGRLFFTGAEPATGAELWTSDGTSAGTIRLTDIMPGPFGSYPDRFADVNGTLYFSAFIGSRAFLRPIFYEIWRSDGTFAGTQRVADIHPGTSSEPWGLTGVNGTLFFAAYAPGGNTELWRSDGTTIGTYPLATFLPGSYLYASPRELTSAGRTLFFVAGDATAGMQLWRSDGTASGTIRVTDIQAPALREEPSGLVVANGFLFFRADDGRHGRELWALPLTTTTTTVTTTTTTTTTLPSSDPPCDGVDGLAAVACVLGQSQPSVCAGQHVRGIERRLDQARKLIDQGVADPLHAQRRVRTAIKILKSTAKVMKKKRMSDECATALARIIQDARSGAERWLAGPAAVDPCNNPDRLDSCASCNTTPGCKWCGNHCVGVDECCGTICEGIVNCD